MIETYSSIAKLVTRPVHVESQWTLVGCMDCPDVEALPGFQTATSPSSKWHHMENDQASSDASS